MLLDKSSDNESESESGSGSDNDGDGDGGSGTMDTTVDGGAGIAGQEAAPFQLDPAEKPALMTAAGILGAALERAKANPAWDFSADDISTEASLDCLGGNTLPLFLYAVIKRGMSTILATGGDVKTWLGEHEATETDWLWKRAVHCAEQIQYARSEGKVVPPGVSAVGAALRHRGVDGVTHKVLSDMGVCTPPEIAKQLTWAWAAEPTLSPEQRLIDLIQNNAGSVLDFVADNCDWAATGQASGSGIHIIKMIARVCPQPGKSLEEPPSRAKTRERKRQRTAPPVVTTLRSQARLRAPST
jgi:hypothetical protein